jgi:PAS domain S-box-containing protein
MAAESPHPSASPRDHFLAAGLSVLICEIVLAGLAWVREGAVPPTYLAVGLILPPLLFLPFWWFLGRRRGALSRPPLGRRPGDGLETNGNPDFLREVFDGIQDGILVLDGDLRLLDANRRAREFFDLPEALDQRECFHVCRNASAPCAACPAVSALADGEPHRSFVVHECPDGARLRLEQAAFPLRKAGGGMAGVILYLSDTSARRREEVERQRLTTALEQVAESILITDETGAIQYVNPAFERITGYARSEVLGETPEILKSGMHGETFYTAMWQTLRRGEVWTGHFVNRKKNGDLFEEEASISPVKDEDGEIVHFVAVKRDVTEEIKMERQLRQAQKMESIGTLAGGIAHDFNNILFPIIGYTEITLEDLPTESAGRANLREVLAAANRAQELVQQILTFSRNDEQ